MKRCIVTFLIYNIAIVKVGPNKSFYILNKTALREKVS